MKPHFERMTADFPQLNRLGIRWNSELIGPLGKIDLLEQEGFKILNAQRGVELQGRFGATLGAFAVDGAKIYKMGRKFSEDLLKVDLDLPVLHLPTTNQIVCIEFANNMRFELPFPGKPTLFAHCAYVFITHERSVSETGRLAKGYLEATFPLYTADGVLTNQIHQTGLVFENFAESFESVVAKANLSSRPNWLPGNDALMRFIMKSVLYIHSGTPDLRDYSAPLPPASNKAKKQRQFLKLHENQALVDMTLVGYDHLKDRIYKTGSTEVRGHFRWQPYGEKFSKVKLIWIDEHERHFKKEDQASG